MSEWALAVRLVLGLVFVFSSILKIIDPRSFFHTVERLADFSPQRARWLAIVLIAAETFTAISLILGVQVQAGLLIATILLIVFSLVMHNNLQRDNPIPCNCFGKDDSVRTSTVALRLGMLWLAACLCWLALGEGLDISGSITDVRATALAVPMTLLGVWILRVPELWELWKIEAPMRSKTRRRVSLQGSPLEPIRVEEGSSEW